MSPPAPLLIEAMVDGAELPALVAAAEQLSERLDAGGGKGWPIDLRAGERDPAAYVPAPSLVVTSLLRDAARTGEPLADTERRWRGRLHGLVAGGAAHRVFLCTVFRYVADRAAPGVAPRAPDVTERIRRLNGMAVELSHDTGVNVVDIDAVFGLVGARALRSDYRMAGPVAAEVAGYAVASSLLLAGGLDDFVPPEVEGRARAGHGGLSGLAEAVNRRLARRGPQDGPQDGQGARKQEAGGR